MEPMKLTAESQGLGNTMYENICLSEQEMEKNHFPSYRHLTKQFILFPPTIKHAKAIISIDCEFCRTTVGLEVIRVIVVNEHLEVILNEIIRPKGDIVDLLEQVHGLSESQILSAQYRLQDIQQMLCQICDQNTLLVGHGLDCDLKGLKFLHFRVADTKVLFNCESETTLASLSRRVLKKEIRKPEDYPLVTMMLSLFLNAQPPKRLAQGGFGCKQALVTRVHSRLISRYQTRLVVPLTTCLRGKDTLRIHCKKWDQLIHAEQLMEQIDGNVRFYQICLPISMKTKSQKKGFFIYLKFFNVNHVQDAFELVSRTKLYKAEIADRPTTVKKIKPVFIYDKKTEKGDNPFL
jgi:hypothetical protein